MASFGIGVDSVSLKPCIDSECEFMLTTNSDQFRSIIVFNSLSDSYIMIITE